MKPTNYMMERYVSGEWFIDILRHDEDDNTIFEAWISHKDVGISMFMFGIPEKVSGLHPISYDQFLEITERNLEDYQRIYKAQHID